MVFAACEDKQEQQQVAAGTTQWVTMLSAESASPMTLPEATQYCAQLADPCEFKLDKTACDPATPESGWRVPNQADLSLYLGVTQTSNNLWTRSANPAVQNTYMFLKISDGSWGYDYAYSPYIYVRCVK